MERARSYSSGWNSRPTPPRVATVKPVSKSLSEDDLMKAAEDRNIPPRVFSRLKVQDLTALKKDSLIGELEKCLEELETEHVTTQDLAENYKKIESERNQLLEELDVAFIDLQEYMKRQKQSEDHNAAIESDHVELMKENEYLKVVLSNRNEIQNHQIIEENKKNHERVLELESKNMELVDEINDLYEERQTLILSLLNLKSEDVDDVIRKRSRSSSVTSRESLDGRLHTENETSENELKSLEDGISKDYTDLDSCKLVVHELRIENTDLRDAFKRVKEERDDAEKELDHLREDKENLEKSYAEKIKEFDKLQEDRNEKNLNLSKLSTEKRTLQRQIDHMRESSRASASKIIELKKEIDALTLKNNDHEAFIEEHKTFIQEHEQMLVTKLKEIEDGFKRTMKEKQEEYEDLLASKKALEKDLEEGKASQTSNVADKEKLEKEVNRLNDVIRNCEGSMNEFEVNKKVLIEKHSVSVIQNGKLTVSVNQLHSENEALKKEVSKFKSDKERIEKQMINRVNTLEIEVNKLQSSKDSLEKMLHSKEGNGKKELSKTSSDNEVLNTQWKYDSVKKENERLLHKCHQLEKLNDEVGGVTAELKRLKEANEVLLQRYRALETEHVDSKSIESEREKYSALLVKYDNLCTQHKNININNDNLFRESKDLTEKNKILEGEEMGLKNRLETLKIELNDLKTNKQKIERDYQYIIKSHKEEAHTQLLMKQNQSHKEKDAIKTKYDLLCVDVEKLNKEHLHYKMTVNTLREENHKLHEEIRKLHLSSLSSQDLVIQRLQGEKDSLERSSEVLQNTLSKVNNENKSLLDRINRTDESVATTMRSLKARKNELQLQVESLKHKNSSLKSNIKNKDRKHSKNNKVKKEIDNNSEMLNLQENLHTAHSKIAELELENREYITKLQESKNLLFELQRALAQAHDLAMQKALEGTKTRRSLEKKVEKIMSENTDLKRKVFLANEDSGELSPSSLFTSFPTDTKKLFIDETKAIRKSSLPTLTNSSNHIIATDLSSSNTASTPHLSSLSDNSPQSPHLVASRQAEQDLSQQLRELLDLTNDLTAVREEFLEDQKSLVASGKSADVPPIPPSPTKHQTDRGYVRLKMNTDYPSMTNKTKLGQVPIDLEVPKKNKLEHWV